MFRTRAKCNDIKCTVKFNNRPMHFSLHKHTHTHTHRAKPQYSATPTWKSVSRQKLSIIQFSDGSLDLFLLYISMHHHPWCKATLRWTNSGAESGFDYTHTLTHKGHHQQEAIPFSSYNSSAATVCRSVCYKFVEWNKRIPLKRISNHKQ